MIDRLNIYSLQMLLTFNENIIRRKNWRKEGNGLIIPELKGIEKARNLGLSVGQSESVTMAMEWSFGETRLVDSMNLNQRTLTKLLTLVLEKLFSGR